MRRVLVLFVLVGGLGAVPGADAGADSVQVTFEGLLGEMTDLSHLGRLPDPWFRLRQASSYDRRSTSPDAAEDWFANADRGHFQRVDAEDGGKRYVLLDAEGPGAVVRIWSADPKGRLRIELDDEVVVEAPMADLLGGKVDPFGPGFAYVASRGFDLYFPFPYQRRCVISSDQGGFYYHVGYRTYDGGTTVEPLRTPMLESHRARIARIDRRLRRGFYPAESEEESVAFVVRRDRPHRIHKGGGGAVLTLALAGIPNDAKLLRRTLLLLTFDGVETVRVPLGDFFGTGPGLHDTRSEPLAVDPDGELWTSLPMPFREVMEIGLAGDGLETFAGEVDVVTRPWDDRSTYLHAVWRAEYGIATKEPRDWTFVDVKGEGLLIGTVMQVANPVRNWWGEGDEKVSVDGETFPSVFGTGTEDYFGYAWCSPAPFERAYHAQPRCDGPGNYGHTSLQRWHVIDPIPFRERARFDMELWHHRRDVELHVAAVTYFYARPGAEVVVPEPVAEARLPPPLPALRMLTISGAIEGEACDARASGGRVTPQDLAHFGTERWSRDQHLWWRGAKEGDALNVFFDAPAEGSHRVLLYLTKARDYGTHRLFVNGRPTGKPPGTPIDLWAEDVVPTGRIDLGVWPLNAGRNELRVRVAGANPAAVGDRHMFGLDCIVLEAAEPPASR